MSTQVIKKTSELVVPKATKSQVIEALCRQEQLERIEHNKKITEEYQALTKKRDELAINKVLSLPKALFRKKARFNKSYYCVEINVKDTEIEELSIQINNLPRHKSIVYSEIKKYITELVRDQQTNENPLLKKENEVHIKMLLDVIKGEIKTLTA